MTNLDRTALQDIADKARAAGGREWFTDPRPTNSGLARIDDGTSGMFPIKAEWPQALFIAAANPAVVLEMVAEITSLRDRLIAAESALGEATKALEPFAAYGREIKKRPDRRQSAPEWPVMSFPVTSDSDPLGLKFGDINKGDFIRAAQAVDLPKLLARARSHMDREAGE